MKRNMMKDLNAVGGGFMSQLEWGSDPRGLPLPVADVMERATDQELRRIIGGAAAESDLYQEERASRAAGEILARLELKALRQQLASIHQELSTCNASLDRTRYSDLIARRVALHSRLKELHALISA